MKFLHISDLHLGKRVNEFSMLDDQKHILKQILEAAKTEQITGILIAGDIYDKSVPSAEAVQLFDWFLTKLAEQNKKVFAISGNHDSAERLAFGAGLMNGKGVYFSPVYNGNASKIVLEDEYGEICIYLLPFLKPAIMRHVLEKERMEKLQEGAGKDGTAKLPEELEGKETENLSEGAEKDATVKLPEELEGKETENLSEGAEKDVISKLPKELEGKETEILSEEAEKEWITNLPEGLEQEEPEDLSEGLEGKGTENLPESYQDAVKLAVKRMNIDPAKRNILVAHQFVTGAGRCDSEDISVGGIDNVDAAVFEAFDYVALGHIHSPQHIGRETIRYCGTPLKYSFSEAEQKKTITVVELKEKGEVLQKRIPLLPLHDMRKIKGTYQEVTARHFNQEKSKEDYVHITLTDEEDILDGLQKLRAIYPNLMQLSYDNSRTKQEQIIEAAEEAEQKSEIELFEEFFQIQNNHFMNAEQTNFMKQLIEEVKELV